MLSRLTPQILKLQSQSRAPITLYIVSSSGGNVAVMQNILRMLKMPDQDARPACDLITVVTNKAQSAAADLLSSGDYSIAMPNSTLLYHGVRTPGLIPALQPLTAEKTSLLAHILRLTNDAYAMELARKIEDRFLFRYLFLRNSFQKIRDNIGENLSDLDCFVKMLEQRLSPRAVRVFRKAQERYAKYEPLLEKLVGKRKKTANEPQAKVEARRIKAIIDFESTASAKDRNWTFKNGGLTKLVEDFYLVSEYFESQQSERFKEWCLRIGKFSLSKTEQAEVDQITDENARKDKLIEKVQASTEPFWMFFVALCHALQEDDNELTATDGYWMGLVDEVMGDSSLISMRWFAEYEEDPPPVTKATNEEGKASPEQEEDAAGRA